MADGMLAAEDEPTVGAEVLPVSESAVTGAGGFDGSEAAAVAEMEVMEVIKKALLQRSLRVMRKAQPVFADGSSIQFRIEFVSIDRRLKLAFDSYNRLTGWRLHPNFQTEWKTSLR